MLVAEFYHYIDQKGPLIDRNKNDMVVACLAEVMALNRAEQRKTVSTAKPQNILRQALLLYDMIQ